MNRLLTKHLLLGLGALAFLTSCDPEIEAPEASAGEANFSKYVALGNSLTAGYTGGALYREGQEVAYPNLLAKQFALVGGGSFSQPLVPEGQSLGIPFETAQGTLLVPRHLVLGVSAPSCGGTPSLGPVPSGAPEPFGTQFFIKPENPGPYNNLGVPGAKSFHLLATKYGDPAGLFVRPITANPYYIRTAPSTTTSVIAAAIAQQPTFFTLWIGSNDVLLYAADGGASDQITPSEGPAGVGFDASLDAIVGTLVQTGAKGAIANIPDITNIPYFNTIPYNGLELKRQGQVDSLNAAYAQAGLNLTFNLGFNPFIIADPTAPNGRRKMKQGELVLLPVSDSLKCSGYGSHPLRPIPNRFALDETEVAQVKTATSAYNAKIRAVADQHNLAHVDAYEFLNRLRSGMTENSATYTGAFVTGGVFGLDGIHFSDRGNAIAANVFIRAINQKYKARIPEVNINELTGIRFPQ